MREQGIRLVREALFSLLAADTLLIGKAPSQGPDDLLGFAVADTLATVHARRALEMALRQISTRLIYYSNRGNQYCRQ